MIGALPERVTVLNASSTGTDSHGNPSMDWAHAASAIERAAIAPVSTVEVVMGQDTVVSRYRIVLHPKTAARPTSRVVWRGAVFEVDGETQLVPTVTGGTSHVQAMLKRVSSL